MKNRSEKSSIETAKKSGASRAYVNKIVQKKQNELASFEEKPEIVPLQVSCSQRPDWKCGPCKAYGVRKPWELV